MARENGGTPLVVVGVDGSTESVEALKWADGYAAATGAKITAVIAWHYPAAVGPAPAGVAPESISDGVRQSMTDEVTKALAEAAMDRSEVQVRVEYGHPAQVLIDQSAEADLLVVGSRGYGRFAGMMLGSVSIHCVTSAQCPVLVVRGES
jgi:nucleotide-binding universal stress UspA family protein